MRMLVSILFDDSDDLFSPAQRSDVFNTVFKDQIRIFGFVDGIPYNSLNAQYQERKKPNVKYDHWRRIYSAAPARADAEKKQSLRVRADRIVSQGRSGTQVLIYTPDSSGSSMSRKPAASTASRKRPAVQETPLPLSKRRAIGRWNPETPQRNAVVRRQSVAKATVKVTPKVASPKSPRKLPDGRTIIVRANVEIPRMMIPVSQHRAQPPLPKLLFRIWREDPENRDSRNGFWSRRHHKANALSPAPPATSIDATDILNHMDRDERFSPFISATSRLIWMVQMVLKTLRDHGSCNVSVINVDALDKRSIWWARPFHDEVKRSYGFKNGAWHYAGTHEWLIWQQIPEAAILHTFNGRDLIALASNDRELRHTLRLEELHLGASMSAKIATLRKQEVPLSTSVVNAIAKVVRFFRVQGSGNHGHIAAMVTGVCEGWGIDIRKRSEQEWQKLANHFADQVGANSDLRARQSIKLAFLDGVAWGLEGPNAKHTLEAITRKEKRAAAVGLASPSDILAHELDALKLALKLHEKSEQSSLRKYHAIEHAPARRSINYLDDDEEEPELYHTPEPDDLEMTGLANEDDEEDIVYDSEDDVFVMG